MRESIFLECSECGNRNYRTSKDSKASEKLDLKKFCKFCRCHTSPTRKRRSSTLLRARSPMFRYKPDQGSLRRGTAFWLALRSRSSVRAVLWQFLRWLGDQSMGLIPSSTSS
jgi:large subunit ribosomal protein L33